MAWFLTAFWRAEDGLAGLGLERRRSVWMVMHPDVARIERVRAVADLTVEHLADR